MGKGCSRNGSEARSVRSSGATELVFEKLKETARQGAQQMLTAALETEVDEFLQRVHYARKQEFRGDRAVLRLSITEDKQGNLIALGVKVGNAKFIAIDCAGGHAAP